ncbi:hypothetical protein CCYA_CCYA02G0767 [Cyanidiococcus yangmingshanensis]|nr:hypothetical protein CCYA_CCYA02G0767 [Cyanidiococcus yangmingshanensis]
MRHRLVTVLYAVAALLLLGAASVRAYQFELTSGPPLCFCEDVLEDDILVGSFLASDSGKGPIHVQVQSPNGELIFESREAHGKFNLRVKTPGTHTLCFSRIEENTDAAVLVSFEWRSVLNSFGETLSTEATLSVLESAAKDEHLEHIIKETRALRLALIQIRSWQIFSRWLRQRVVHTQRMTSRFLLYFALMKLLVLGLTTLEATRSILRRLDVRRTNSRFRGV